MSDNSEFQLKRLPRFKPRGGVEVMLASIRALFLRELQTRFGHYRLGYLWVFLEPALNVLFMLILFGAIVKRVLPGIEYPVFLINGILPFFFFRKSAMQAIGAIGANKGLLSYRNVKPIDIIFARVSLELLLYFICYVLLTGVLIWIGYTFSFSNVPFLILCWFTLILLTFGISLLFMVVGSWSNDLNKLLMPLFFILYFISGAIVPLHSIPERYLIYFLWNPLAHIFELMRHSVSPNYSVLSGVSYTYCFMIALTFLFIGLGMCRIFNKEMLKTK
ncbi:MAG: ABC transporter permease [Pseudomonadota bacterium]|nr:ABC transporter permease [Pseudomonadota bacterium]